MTSLTKNPLSPTKKKFFFVCKLEDLLRLSTLRPGPQPVQERRNAHAKPHAFRWYFFRKSPLSARHQSVNIVCTTALVLVVALLGYQSKRYCIPNAIPECSAIKKWSTRAQTSVHWQAHSGNCTLAPKKCMHKTIDRVVLQVGWFKKTIAPPLNWPQQSTFETRCHFGMALHL